MIYIRKVLERVIPVTRHKKISQTFYFISEITESDTIII